MGIALNELLAQEFFKDFRVISGRRGLYKEVQGVAIVDAPDAFRWSKGREFVMTSGYAISMNPDCIRQSFEEGGIQLSTAIAVKRGRYLNQMPEDMVALCEAHDVPLIEMPFEVAFMDVMNQINVAVLNRTIRRFRIQANPVVQLSGLSYKEQKIKKILQAVEQEMKFPAFIYDLTEENEYYSSPNFTRITESYGLEEMDYWNPPANCSKHTLCDYTGMTRYRQIDYENPDGPRISWVLTPITIGKETKAYFAVMESKELLDYYDEYAIRIAFLMLQEVYEEVTITQSMGYIGFENFVMFAINYHQEDPKRLAYQANQQGISMDTRFVCVKFHQKNAAISARNQRKIFVEVFQNSPMVTTGKLAFTDENDGIILLEIPQQKEKKKEEVIRQIRQFDRRLSECCAGLKLEYGICLQERTLSELAGTMEKCKRTLEIGRKVYPRTTIWDYDSLGPFVWMQIPEEELNELLEQYRKLAANEKDKELLRTLKLYLENNMNYSITAERMYVHINTVRKRIEKIDCLLKIDWEHYIGRLKVELLLQFLELDQG